jgi:hypothetical protein
LFHIEGQDASEGAFIFRTGSYNSVNDMRVRLQSLHAGFGGKLSGLPMRLELRLKSTAMSNNQAFYYASLEPNFASFKEAMGVIKERAAEESACGFDRKAFEESLVQLLSNGSFSENVEDAGEYEDLIAARPSLPPKGAGSVKGHTHFAKSRPIEALEDLSSMYGAATNASTSQPLLIK